MDNKRVVNRDFISVIKNDGDRLRYEEVIIPYPRELVVAIEAMSKDESCTVMDIQELFLKYYPKQTITEPFYHYIYPYPYRYYSKTVADSPTFNSFDSYKRCLIKQGGYFPSCLYNNESPLGFESKSAYQEAVAWICKELNVEPSECCNLLRKDFSTNIIRYIYARNYHETLASIKSSVLMYSAEEAGWRTVSANLGNGLTATISTNFSFPCDWYIDVRIYINNILLLPFSDSIVYPSVQWQTFQNATRSFENEDRESCWQSMFHFLVDIANRWKELPERFVANYIKDEIEETAVGLEKLMQTPDERMLEQYEHISVEKKRSAYVSEKLDLTLSKAEPELASMFLKYDKTAGLLYYLDLFYQLSEFDSSICQFIDKLTTYIDPFMTRLRKEIRLNIIELEEIKKSIRDIKSKIITYKEEYAQEFDDLLNLTGSDRRNFLRDKPQFAEIYKDYKAQKKQIIEFKQRLTEKSSYLRLRKNYLKSLRECKSKIEKSLS